jgi:hypothetical protein
MLRGWPRDVMEMRLEVLGSNTSAKRKKCLSDAISKHLLGLVHEMKRNEYLAARCKYADEVFNAYAIHTNIFIFIFTCVCICIPIYAYQCASRILQRWGSRVIPG